MNNNVKEILDYYRKNNEKYEKSMLSQFNEKQLETTFHVSYQRYKNHKTLLDYITNLQKTQETLIKNDNEIITNLQEIRKEHSIMKQFIYENGLWEKFLNDDRFLEHLRSDEDEQ